MTEAHPSSARRRRCRTAACGSIPLGGLGAIGRNMTVFEYDGKLLDRRLRGAVPGRGAARRRPDPAGLRARSWTGSTTSRRSCSPTATRTTSARCRTCCAHKPDIPLVGSQFTLALVEAKLRRAPHRAVHADRRGEGRRERLGPFECEFFAVNHSIPDALAVADPDPGRPGAAHRRLQDGPAAAGRPDHRPGRLRPARRRGRRPAAVRLHQRRDPGLRHARSGRSARCSTRSSRKATRRIIVASFASHVHRVQQVLDAAHEHGRKVAFDRPLDGPQHGHRPRPRPAAHPGRAWWSAWTRRPRCRRTRSC